MIRFDHVSVTYPDTDGPTLRDVSLTIAEGELCVVIGSTGAGKSTLLGAINGLVPHFTGGLLSGTVTVNGKSTRTHPPRELAEVVGVVGQDPLAGFVTDIVEDELAYGMEQLAIGPDVMRKRVEETLDLLGIADLRHRALRTLSGGQQQRVAIGSVLTNHPSVIVLDEPTSALDPTAAEDVLATVTRLVHDLGVTVVMAEHRLERVIHYADSALYLPGDGRVVAGTPAEVLEISTIAPPIVHLGRLTGWSPLPLSVRDARRAAAPLRDRLGATAPPARRPTTAEVAPIASRPPSDATAVTVCGLTVVFGRTTAVNQVDLSLLDGEIVALMGRNGSGKSTLMWALQGSGHRTRGTVGVRRDDGTVVDTDRLSPAEARALVGLVPQNAADLLYLDTVAQECAQADLDAERATGTCDGLLERLVPGIDRSSHPRDLSEGQRLALVLAIQLTASPRTVLLDEPTRGLDYNAKENLTRILRELAEAGHAVMVSTHDVEFVAASADRVAVMAQGEIVADGPTVDVIVSSPAFAPQVAKVLAPQRWLTVAEVRGALAANGPPESPAPTGPIPGAAP